MTVEEATAKLDTHFSLYRDGTLTREQLEARLAFMQESVRKWRMPDQNFLSGYISGWLASLEIGDSDAAETQ